MSDMNALREVETAWLSAELSRAISNLGYPVGCGIAPQPEHIGRAAGKLFDRYAIMIEMARKAGFEEGRAASRTREQEPDHG